MPRGGERRNETAAAPDYGVWNFVFAKRCAKCAFALCIGRRVFVLQAAALCNSRACSCPMPSVVISADHKNCLARTSKNKKSAPPKNKPKRRRYRKSSLPQVAAGCCTVIMFGAIIVSGVTMLGECGFDQRNTIIAATSFAIGIGVTQVPEFFSGMPQIISDIFAGNPVAGVFVVAMVLSLALPKKVKAEDIGAITEETMESKKPE